MRRVEPTRRRNRPVGEVRCIDRPRHGQPHGAVEQPRIEVRQPVMPGEPQCERALSRSGRSIHCDDHDPSEEPDDGGAVKPPLDISCFRRSGSHVSLLFGRVSPAAFCV
jgi:hypothetical protein